MANLKKRLLATLLAVIMVFTLVPAAAGADTTSSTEPIPGGEKTVTVTVTATATGETTTTTENWESTTPASNAPAVTEADGSVTTETGATTHTEGSQTSTEELSYTPDSVSYSTGNGGSETSTTNSTVVNTKTEEDVVVIPETTTKEESTGFVQDSGAEQTDIQTTDNGWGDGTVTDGSFEPTADPLPEPSEPTEVPGQLQDGFFEGEQVELWMEPDVNGGKDSDTVDLDFTSYKVDILPEDISSELQGTTMEDGKPVDISPITETLPDGTIITKTRTVTRTMEADADGNLHVTYTVTTTDPVKTTPLTEEQKKEQLEENKQSSTSTVGGEYYEYSDTPVSETYKTIPTPAGAEVSEADSAISGYKTITETVKDAEGNVVQTIVRTPVEDKSTGKIAYDVVETTYSAFSNNSGNAVSSSNGSVAGYTEMPKSLPAPDAVSENGQTTQVSFESVLDANGNHVGFKATTTVTDANGNPSTSTSDITGDSYSYVASTGSYYGRNTTTTVTVEKLLDANGNHIGYTTTSVTTDENGNVLSQKSDSVEQTVYAPGTSTTTSYGQTNVKTRKFHIINATKKQDLSISSSSYIEQSSFQDITKEVYQLVELESGLYLAYQGELYNITGTYTVGDKEFVATGGTNGSVDLNKYLNSSADDDLNKSGGIWSTGGGWNKGLSSGDWTFTGHALFSDFKVDAKKGSSVSPHSLKQFVLKDGKNTIYAYCIEMGANTSPGRPYDELEFNKDSTHPVYNDSYIIEGENGTIGKIRSIATNGFWGTESGLGSLQAVKDLMIRNGLSQYADDVTEGVALAATQIAFWEYGKNTDTAIQYYENYILSGYDFHYTQDGGFELKNTDGTAADNDKEAAANALRDLLISLAEDSGGAGQAEALTADKVSGAGIVLKDYKGQSTSGDHTYNGDVQFGLDISTSSLNGDLVVKVLRDGKEIAKARLAGDANHGLFRDITNTIYPDSNGVFTIEDVELIEGVPITLNLDGIQQLDSGVYLLHAEKNPSDSDWQDFVTLTSQEAEVDISMDLKFTVEDDPNYIYTNQEWTEKKVDRSDFSKVDEGVRTLEGTEETSSESGKVIGYSTTITKQSKTIKESSEWGGEFSMTYDMTTTDGDGPPPPPPPPPGDEIIEEEPVPLGKAPGTGENFSALLVLCIISGYLLIVNNSKKRREQ